MRRLTLILLIGHLGCGASTGADVRDAAREQSAHTPLDGAGRDVPAQGDDASSSTPSLVGGPCGSTAACSEGLDCDTTHPGGVCTKPCSDDGACPGRARCAGGRCRARCEPRALTETCRAGFACSLGESGGACIPRCDVRPCEHGERCDELTGLCLDPISGVFGETCDPSRLSCRGVANGHCLDAEGTGAGGICTVPCAPVTRPCTPPFANALCLLGPSSGPFCALLCARGSTPPCADGLTCKPIGAWSVCLP